MKKILVLGLLIFNTIMVYGLDVGVDSIIFPTDTIVRGWYSPQVQVTNYSGVQVTDEFYTHFKIFSSTGNQVYWDSSKINNINAGQTRTLNFNGFVFNVGPYTYKCSTNLIGDTNPLNDIAFDSVFILYAPPWNMKESLPLLPSNKAVKHGGALVAAGNDRIYALKGNKTKEFYYYDMTGDSWVRVESIPNDPINRKTPAKGAAMAIDRNQNPDIIYATKGNGTHEFWAYNVETDTWISKADVPNLAKKVKGGSSMVYEKRGPEHYIYLLKASSTREFYAYDCLADTWILTLDSAPLGPDNKKFKDGTAMCSGKGDTLYVLKGGAKYNEFYGYDMVHDTWITLESIPRYNPILDKKTKVKDGARIVYDGDSIAYVLKGGNKQDFWMYNANQHRWTAIDTIPARPRKKKVGGGAGMVLTGNQIYVMKGNKTNEFWTYVPGISDVIERTVSPSSYIAQNSIGKDLYQTGTVKITGNPINRNSKIMLNLNRTAQVKIKLYSNLGQLVNTIHDAELERGSYEINIGNLNIAAGIYHLRSDIGDESETVKIIIK